MNAKLGLSLRQDQRLALLGRLRMAQWIEMKEPDFAREVADLEKDALFRKLAFGTPDIPGAIRRQRWPGSRMSTAFLQVNEGLIASGERVKVEETLGEHAALIPKIQTMGMKAFEKYFVYATESVPLAEIAKRTGLTLEDVTGIHDMLLEVGAQAEFFVPKPEPSVARPGACLARLSVEGGEPSFEFYSAYWARGLYNVRYDLLEKWKKKSLSGEERKRLRHLLKRIEIVNLRQSTIFRILEALAKLQAEYLRTREDDHLRPISLRLLAHRLDLAPSTVSRALHGRCVRAPWGAELPLIRLVPGRRNVLREILGRWSHESTLQGTDAALARRLKTDYGIAISRRTVNAVRNEIVKAAPPVEPRP